MKHFNHPYVSPPKLLLTCPWFCLCLTKRHCRLGCISSSYAGVSPFRSLPIVCQVWQLLRHLLQSPLVHAGLESEATSPRLFNFRATNVYRWSRAIFPLILNFETRLKWVFNITSRSPYLPERALAPFRYEAWWVPEPLWTIHKEKNILRLPGFDPQIVQQVA